MVKTKTSRENPDPVPKTGPACLTPAQGLEDVHGSILLDAIGKGFSIDHDGVVDAEVHMPAQRPLFVEDVIGEARRNFVDGMQHLGDRAGRHRDRAVLQLGKEPVEMSGHGNRGHAAQPKRTE